MTFSAEASGTADSRERGLEIAEAVDKRDEGFGDSVAEFQMILKNAAGDTVSRDVMLYTLEMPDDGDKSITRFNSPPDVQGTALLTWSHTSAADEQWLYLPSLSRVKRISSSNKTGPFVGSEFSFEDLASQEVEKYRYDYLGDTQYEGSNVHVIERIPVDADSGYSKQISLIEIDTLNVLRTDYYDRSGEMLKTLLYEDYRQYHERYWRPHLMNMINHQTGKETKLAWNDYEFGNGFDDSFFRNNRLKSMR